MTSLNNCVEFSENGEYAAYSTPDGTLKIWETSTNILKQEYIPSAHLSATCSSLRWGPCAETTHAKKKAKTSKGNVSMTSDLSLIAMGTLIGDIHLYNFKTAKIHSVFKNVHNGTVNDICWFVDDGALYSCSSDQHIVISNLSSGKIKAKWKADSNPVHSICVIDDSNMLSSSHTIKWWNTKQKTVIKTFLGHITEVFRILPIKSEKSGSYFLSVAIADRVINAWHLNESGSQKPVAKFLISDEPQNINLVSKENEPLLLSVVSKDGSLHLFEHMLNGRVKKPLEAKVIVQVGTKAEELKKPQLMPILAVSISEGITSCMFMYGSFIKPVFEKMDLSDAPQNHFLVRHISLFTSEKLESSVQKIKQTDKSGRVKTLAPGHMMAEGARDSSGTQKKVNKSISELPMEERLKALALSKIPENIEESTVSNDSMIHLLLQGLQSKDNEMLNTVLHSTDELIIHNTVQRLPLQSIFLLLKELHERLSKQEYSFYRNQASLTWVKILLEVHLPYLLSCPDSDEYLGPISQLLEAMLQNFPKMCQLRGCLNVLLSNATDDVKEKITSQPLNVYISESSEESECEEMEEDELLPENTSIYENLQDSCEDEDVYSENGA